jgi:hypothetical protein
MALNAQNFSGKLLLGINGSQIDGDGMSGYYQGGLAAGVGVRFPISEKVSVGPEILYSMKGSRASLDQINELGYPRIIYRLNYLDIPLVVEYRQSRAIQLEMGLSVNYLLASKLDNGTNLGFVEVDYLFNKMDFQLLGGLKYRLFDDCWLSGRLLYSVISTNKLGLTSFNYGLAGSPSRGGFFNNVLQFTLSYRLFGAKETE